MDKAACKTLVCFDPSNAAGFHAQLTGILAGLAFTSIVLILQSSTLKGRGAEAGLLSFFSALVTLLISAFLDGTAAGEELIAGRLAIMVFLAGIASAVAVLELFYGLTWLVRAGGFPNATGMTARISALVIPLITFVYLVISALNLWVPVIRSPHATCAYSWISPPSRSRRTVVPAGRATADSPGPSGGTCPKARCGR
jgi:hypothetical protein